MVRIVLVCIALTSIGAGAGAAEFCVDPVSGSPGGDGSVERPWRTIQEVFDGGLVESQQWDHLPHTDRSKLVVRNAGAPVRADWRPAATRPERHACTWRQCPATRKPGPWTCIGWSSRRRRG